MDRLVRPLRSALADFVEQREKLNLLLSVKGEGDITVALKLLEAAGESAAQDLYLIFGHTAPDAAAYMDALMADCALQIEAGNKLVEAGGGDPGAEPWEELPQGCLDSQKSPRERITSLVGHIRRYYPDPVIRVVLGLLPTSLDELNGYFEAARDLFAFEGYEPWMAGLRIVLLDLEDQPELAPWVRAHGEETVEQMPLNYSPAAIVGAIAEEAQDPEADPESRVQSLLQLAGLDYAYGRLDESLRKYGAAYEHYRQAENPPMQGVCLLGAGQVHERRGEDDWAAERFRQALEAGIASESPQLILNASMSLAALHQKRQDFEGASQYWLATAATARHQSNLYLQADAMEQQGLCRLALHDSNGARELWGMIPEVCTPIDYHDRACSALSRLVELEGQLGLEEERRVHAEQLESLQHKLTLQRAKLRVLQGGQSQGGMH